MAVPVKKIAANDPETRSADVVSENLDRLRELFPDAFSDGKVDFDVLRQLVGDSVDDGDEKYGLNWHGKRRARQLALTPSTGTLRPCVEDSVDWDTTQNLLIEGDNLEVLKLLRRSYGGRIKLIFTDPPYNTGKDRIYPDDYRDSIGNYMELTGQVGDDGQKLSSNTETSGRFHTNWLNLMYPRLLLARHLLTQDGVILIVIDDSEIHNLRALCDEVFGSTNFCGSFVWEKKKKPSFLDSNMGSVTDFIVAYAKSRTLAPPFLAGSVEDGKKYPFNNAGNAETVLCFQPQSVAFSCDDQMVRAQDMSEGNIVTELLNDVRIVNSKNVDGFRLRGEWRYSQAKLDEFVASGAEIVISKLPFRPNYVRRSGEGKKTSNLLSHRVNGVPTNEDATQEMRQLFGMDVMSYPKPPGLAKYLVRAITSAGDIVLDMFAGSGTTAGGVWQQNVADGMARRCVLVQLPEPLDPKNREQSVAVKFLDAEGRPRNLAELTKAYLRRAGRRLLEAHPMFTGDLGFRVFQLASTNFLEWKPDPRSVERSLHNSVETLKPERSDEDFLFEVALKRGFDLCAALDVRVVDGKRVYGIADGSLVACLDRSLTATSAEAIGAAIVEWGQRGVATCDVICVFRDSAFADDVTKINLICLLRDAGISKVLSI